MAIPNIVHITLTMKHKIWPYVLFSKILQWILHAMSPFVSWVRLGCQSELPIHSNSNGITLTLTQPYSCLGFLWLPCC